MGETIIEADFAQGAIAPVERVRFGWGRLGERVGFLRGNEHFFGAKAFADNRVHRSPHKLVESSVNQRAGNGHFIAIVRVRRGLFQNDVCGMRCDVIIDLFALQKIVRCLYQKRNRSDGTKHHADAAQLFPIDFRRCRATDQRPIETGLLADLFVGARATIVRDLHAQD